MWVTILVIAIILYYFYYKLEKRVNFLEKSKGPGYSVRFRIDAHNAVIKHKMLGKLTNIQSAIKGKDYSSWTETEKSKLRKIYKKSFDKSIVDITYLASENAYFINDGHKTNIVLRDEISTLIYSSFVIGDENTIESPVIEFSVYERLVKEGKNNYKWVLAPCLEYRENMLDLEKKNDQIDILFEFPLYENHDEQKMKQLGFKVTTNKDYPEGCKDIFGKEFAFTQSIYEKNGVELKYFTMYTSLN